MLSCNLCNIHADTRSKLSFSGIPIDDPTLYHSLAGALQYLTFTRPDIAYAVQQACLHMHAPREPHLHALKRIRRYLQGMLIHGIHLRLSSVDYLISLLIGRDVLIYTAFYFWVLCIPRRFSYLLIFKASTCCLLF